MKRLTHFAIMQWRLTLVLMLIAVFGGIFTYLHQPSQEDPEITIRTAVVTAQFPGMDARRVEQLLTKPLEETVRQLPEVKTITSASQTGATTVKVEIGPQYADVKRVWSDLRNKVADLVPSLPAGTIGPQVNDDYGRVAVTTLALHGEDYTLAELRGMARLLRDRIGALSLVSRVDLFGVQEERIWLEFDRTKLTQSGISTADVLRVIAEQNRLLASGLLETAEGMRYSLAADGAFQDWLAIGDVPVPTQTGALVYVRDFLKVTRGYVDPARSPVLFNDRRAVVLAVAMTANAPIQHFSTQLQTRLQDLRASLPLGMSLDAVTDQPPIVAASVREATENLLQTVATVLAVVILFLGMRAGSIVGAIVPLTIFLSLVGMLLWGIPLHRISIAAIIIALGLLVDNAVVMTEDIKKRLDEGSERMAAAMEASRTLAVPLLTSSLTTILAFLPLMLAQDATGEFLRALSQVMIITLLGSWLLSVTVTPLLCVAFLKSGGDQGGRYQALMSAAYAGLLARALRHNAFLLVAAAAALAASLFAFATIPTGLLPPSERAQFVFNLELPAGSSEAETAVVARRVARFLADRDRNPEIASSVLYVGGGGPRFFLALSPADSAPHVAFGVVNVAEARHVAALRARLEEFFAAQMPEGRGWTELLFLGSEPPGTLQIRITGDDIDQLYQRGEQMKALFAGIDGTRDIRSDWANPVLQINVLIDQERARRSNLAPAEIARSLQATFEGAHVTDYREGDTVIPVVLRAQQGNRTSLDDLVNMTVLSASGVAVPLLQVARLGGELQPWTIRRHNQERALTVSAVHQALPAAQLLAAIEPLLKNLDLPQDWRWEADGEVAASRDANAALFQFMPHCLAAILVILIWQFNSLRRPLIIFLTIPLVLIGASVGLLLTGGVFDFNAMLGLFSLAGIIVNNGIVLIDRIDEARRTGAGLQPALIAACQARLRPIVMTTLTTILGLVPLHLFGGELWHSMTVVMIFGLGIGTVLTLGVVPALYAALFHPLLDQWMERLIGLTAKRDREDYQKPAHAG